MNNKVIVKFKNDAKGDIILEFVGLKSKMYSYQKLNTGAANNAVTTKKPAKGLQTVALAKLRHHEFKAQLDHP